MPSSLKLLGLSLLAIALCATVAAPAAFPANFNSPWYPVTVEGAQTSEHKLTIQGQTITCKTTILVGSLASSSEQLKLTPEYKECTAGLLTPTIDVNGCSYLYSATSGSGDNYAGGAQISCPSGKEIVITAGPCTIKVPGQTPTTSKADYVNETGSPREILLTSTMEGVHSSVVSGSGCALAETSTNTTLKITGASRLSGSGGSSVYLGEEPPLPPVAEFTASSYPASISGGQTTQHTLTIQGQSTKCSTVTFSASISAVSELLELTPVYSGCTAFGFLEGTVSMNECRYRLKVVAGGAHEFEGSTQIVCPAGKTITIVAATCTVHIPPQVITSGKVDLENETGSADVLLTWTLEGIHSTITSGFLCPFSSKETDTTGKFTGSSRLEGSGVGIDVG